MALVNSAIMVAMTNAEVMHRALEACEKAYSPYSRIQVGCALLSESGNLYTGCNVENASYGLTICAERNTLFTAVAREGPAFRLARLAVVAKGHEFPPCGACRQVIAEFAGPDTPVTFLHNGRPVTLTVAELLPSAFSLT